MAARNQFVVRVFVRVRKPLCHCVRGQGIAVRGNEENRPVLVMLLAKKDVIGDGEDPFKRKRQRDVLRLVLEQRP